MEVEGIDCFNQVADDDPDAVGEIRRALVRRPQEVAERAIDVVVAIDIATTNRASASSGGNTSGIGSPILASD